MIRAIKQLNTQMLGRGIPLSLDMENEERVNSISSEEVRIKYRSFIKKSIKNK